jgi:hypothetical protein
LGVRLILAFFLVAVMRDVAESALVLDALQIKTRTAIRKTPIARSKKRPPIRLSLSSVIGISTPLPWLGLS